MKALPWLYTALYASAFLLHVFESERGTKYPLLEGLLYISFGCLCLIDSWRRWFEDRKYFASVWPTVGLTAFGGIVLLGGVLTILGS